MPVLSNGQVSSSGSGLTGLLAVWRRLAALLTTDLPALWAAIGKLH